MTDASLTATPPLDYNQVDPARAGVVLIQAMWAQAPRTTGPRGDFSWETGWLMGPERLAARYREIQEYVGWTDEDVELVREAAPHLRPHLPALVDDFYDAILRSSAARGVLTGGERQIERLRNSLHQWLEDLLAGVYDQEYVSRRWRVGQRHVEIGLDQVFTNLALARLRAGVCRILLEVGPPEGTADPEALISLNKLLDMDLAIIEDAYQAEHLARSQVAERLATLGQVAGGVAHELRNPLNVVKTSVYFLRHAKHLTPEKQEEHFHRIEKHVDLADRVITALSNFAKMPTPHMRPVSLEAAVADALDAYPTTPAVNVTCVTTGKAPWAMADPDQLRIVLGNLIRNACDAMPGGGPLRFEARQQENEVELKVSDEGTGIAPDVLSRVMEPLFSTKARGLGLGLSIARSILEKNRGGLVVASALGQGTTFTLRLMAAPDQDEIET